MTEITYEYETIRVEQSGKVIKFRPCDLTYDNRMELMRAVEDIPLPQLSGYVGFLKNQSVEVRQEALEEALGVSFPIGDDDYEE